MAWRVPNNSRHQVYQPATLDSLGCAAVLLREDGDGNPTGDSRGAGRGPLCPGRELGCLHPGEGEATPHAR